MTEDEVLYSATLVIFGGAFEPSVVTRMLGWEPSQAWRKGDRRSFTRADGTEHFFDSHHEWSGWKLWLDEPQTQRDLLEQLQYWAELLRPKAANIRNLRDQGTTVELNCCVNTSGSAVAHVPSALQAEFGAWGVDLDITFYAHAVRPSH